MVELAIRVEGLYKQFPGRDGPVKAVDGLDLEIPHGQCFGLLGPNGAGKTTTVEILEGLNTPTSGSVEVLGRRWDADEQAIRERIGVTLQETRFPEKATVIEMVRLFRSFFHTGIEPREVLDRVALESKASSFVETLSGGQKQRLAVAIALVGDPELLFLDEPTTGLDPQARRQLWDVIRELQGRGRTTLLTTHYMDEAEKLCDRVAIVDQGKIIALGSPADLIARIGGEHVVEFAVGEGAAIDPSSLDALETVRSARAEADGYAMTVGQPHRAIPALLERLAEEGRPLARLTTRQVSLEDVFVSLTGRHLRDDENVSAEKTKNKSRKRSRRGELGPGMTSGGGIRRKTIEPAAVSRFTPIANGGTMPTSSRNRLDVAGRSGMSNCTWDEPRRFRDHVHRREEIRRPADSNPVEGDEDLHVSEDHIHLAHAGHQRHLRHRHDGQSRPDDGPDQEDQ